MDLNGTLLSTTASPPVRKLEFLSSGIQLAFKQDNNLTDSREDPTDIPSCQSNDRDTSSTYSPLLDRLNQLEQNRKK